LCPAVRRSRRLSGTSPHSSAISRISNRRSAASASAINAIAPGIAETALTGPFEQRPDIYNLYAAHTVFNRWSSADEVATAVAYLASDAASYVSGSTLFVDGGWTAIDGQPTGLTQLAR
jgi:NAD(P)-dependent dehydrogenase (short-subunit alcohol dehydrogenase family)